MTTTIIAIGITMTTIMMMDSGTKNITMTITRVSGAGEFHPRALPEPDVNLSIHPAPITRRHGGRFVRGHKLVPQLLGRG
jgi:hypothetical protein